MAQSTTSAHLARTFGWAMLATLLVYLINTVLTLGFQWPGPASVLGGEVSLLGALQLALYILGVVVAWQWVSRNPAVTLRTEAEQINRFNVFLIRGLFWSVLLIGLADMAISFLRVEDLLRVDVFYAGMSPQGKGFINAIGATAMGCAMCWTILLNGLGSKSAIIYSPMVNFEVSQSGFGMYTKYLMAGFLGVFAITMLIQFVSQFLEATADYRGDPDARVIESASAH